MTETEIVGLNGGQDKVDSSTKAFLFAQLLKLALPTVEHYRSDFFHDALWIEENVKGPMTIYFAFRQTGTNIGITRFDVFWQSNEKYYEIVLFQERSSWKASITEVEKS